MATYAAFVLVVLMSGACVGGDDSSPKTAPSPPAIDASQLGQLIPESALPQGFEEFHRGPAIFDGAPPQIPPSLLVDYRDAQGSSITFVVVVEGDERAARRWFDMFAENYERPLYRFLNEPDLTGEFQPVYECDRAAGPPPAENACAFVEKSPLDVGREARAFASAAPIQGKDVTGDIFLRDRIVAWLSVHAVAGAGLSQERERLAEEFDSRIRTHIHRE